MTRAPVHLTLAWVFLFALYLMFAGTASRAELCAAALAAAVGIGVQVHIRLRGQRTMRLAAPWLRLAGRIGTSLTRETLMVGGALARAIANGEARGGTQRQAFALGGDTPEATGRRAVVMLGASVAPNGFVWPAGPEDGDLLRHRLVPAPPSGDTLWPV